MYCINATFNSTIVKKFKKILLVDDDDITNHLNSMILADIDIAEDIISFESGQEALSFIKEKCIHEDYDCPDLILLDLNMPDINGKEVIESLKTLDRIDLVNHRIAVLTSSDHPKDIQFLKEIGVKAILNKPLTADKISALITQFDNDPDSFS